MVWRSDCTIRQPRGAGKVDVLCLLEITKMAICNFEQLKESTIYVKKCILESLKNYQFASRSRIFVYNTK